MPSLRASTAIRVIGPRSIWGDSPGGGRLRGPLEPTDGGFGLRHTLARDLQKERSGAASSGSRTGRSLGRRTRAPASAPHPVPEVHLPPLRLPSAVLLLLLGLATSGCVAKSLYVDLEADYAATREELTARISELEAELNSSRTRAAARTAELEEALAKARRQVNALEGERALLIKDHSKLQASADDMANALRELERRKAAAEQRVAAFRDLLERFQSLIDAGTLNVRIIDGRMVVQLATDVLFDSGSAKVSAKGKAALQEIATVLQDIPERRYQVEGHTDNDPISTGQYPSNWELASARSIAVVRTMLASGLGAARVSAASYGEFRPTEDNATAAGKTQNRRIEIALVPDLADLPGFAELAKASN